MDIIENNRNLYPKTDYLFVDFIFKDLTSDDAYPIFEEMEKKKYPVHYITEHDEIFEKYCKNEEICSKIIKLGEDYDNYADFFEKHLTLVLKLKAVVSCKESGFHFASYLFYRLEYITYIAVTHGVCYFKDYLFEKRRIYGKMRNNKIVIPPSNLLIEQARKYGWRNEDIIKINLPRWDKYNEEYQLKNKDEFTINSNSILVMFTWRYNKESFNGDVSPFYHENITRILESDLLNDALERKNITLYFTFHRYINKRFRKRYEDIIKEKKQIKFIEQGDIAQCLAVTKLVVTDFSSIIFDLMYRRKPFILFVPDGNDPKIKDIYTDDYVILINDMNQKKFKVENLFFSVRETVDKMISYIENNFALDEKIVKYFELFGLKKGNNIDTFIDYLTNLK
jgi:CDP-glycerol glycerophosphotransferase (TagB/SpsB family)